jgi:hypothetical protein
VHRGVPPQRILQFLTTEHFTLQTAKSAIVAESNGRAALYLSFLSASVVALAFVGQVSKIGTTFLVFGLALFLPLFFLGIATFVRLYETSTESMMHARRINRIRHYYVQVAPEMAPYFAHRTHDDMNDFLDELAIFVPEKPSRWWGLWQQMLSIAGAIAVINSVLAGVFVGFALHAVFALALAPTIAICAAVVIAGSALHLRYMEREHRAFSRHFETMFPNV